MPESYRQDVRDLALFADMDQVNFESLMRGSYVQNFPPRIDLITEGDSPDFLHVVVSGAVDLFSSSGSFMGLTCSLSQRQKM